MGPHNTQYYQQRGINQGSQRAPRGEKTDEVIDQYGRTSAKTQRHKKCHDANQAISQKPYGA